MARLAFYLLPVAAFALPAFSCADESSEVEPASAESAAELLAVPEQATADELMSFIRGVNRRPSVRFKSRAEMLDYVRRSSRAKILAANRLWKIGRKDSQLVAVVQTKADGLSTLGQLGDVEAQKEVASFLHKMAGHENPKVASAARRLRIQGVVRQWRNLTSETKAAVIGDLSTLLEADAESLANIRLALNVANDLGDTEDAPFAVELLEGLLPRVEASSNQKVLALAPKMRGLLRRLELPGGFIEVEGDTLAGQPIDWASYRGKVVLVDYWATWCGPCIAELPNIKQAYHGYNAKGFEVVGVSLDKSADDAESFLAERDIPWATLLSEDPDASGWDHPMAVKYGIRGIPRAILVDPEGKVVHMNARGAILGRLLKEMLGEPVAQSEDANGGETGKVANKP